MGGSRPKRRKTVNWTNNKRRRAKKPRTQFVANTEKTTPEIQSTRTDENNTLINGKRIVPGKSNLKKPNLITSREMLNESTTDEGNPLTTETMPSTSSLKIKKDHFLNLLNKLTPSDKKSNTEPIHSANDLHVPRCNRISRPVFLGDWSSSEDDDDEELEKQMAIRISLPPPIVVRVVKASDLDSAVTDKRVEMSSRNSDVKKFESTRRRKPKARSKLTMRKKSKNAAQGFNKFSNSSLALPKDQPLPEDNGMPDSLLFDEIEMKEARLCLQRVDEQDEFRDFFRKIDENEFKTGKETEMDLFGSDVSDNESESSEDERTTPKSRSPSPPLPILKPQLHSCTACDSKFENEFALEVHMEKEHSDQVNNPKPIKCSYCSRFFTNRRMLLAHEALHTNKTKIIIDCPKNENKHYICQFCTNRFKTGTGLLNHMGKRHPKSVASKDPKNYRFRKRISVARNHMLPRKESIADVRAAIEEDLIPPAESIYVNQDGTIFFGIVKEEMNLETPTMVVEEPEADDFIHTNVPINKRDAVNPMIMKLDETEFVDAETEDISTTDPLMSQGDENDMLYNEDNLPHQLQEGVSLDLTDGIQCPVSNMGSLLDLLDGPDPNLGVPGYTGETMTLNYEGNDEGQGIFKCEYCPKVLSSKSLYQLHCKQSHFARIRKPYICLHPNCSLRFDSSQSLQFHRNKVHSRKEDVSEAPLVSEKESEVTTGFSFVDTTNEDAVTHQSTLGSSDAAVSEICEEAMELPTQQSGVHAEQPVASISTIAERNEDLLHGFKYKCKVCGTKFKKLSAFVKHEWEHSEDSSMSQCCPYCPRRFIDRTSYILHTKCHMSAHAAFEGEGSDKVISITRNLTASRLQRKTKDTTPLLCQHCELVFTTVSSYVSHVNDVHSNVTDILKYHCPYPQCRKTVFKHSWNFRAHVASHLINPECNICGATFTCSTNLRKHIRNKHANSKWTEIVSQTKLQLKPRKRAVRQMFQYCTTCMKKVDCASELHICAEMHQVEFPCQLCGKIFDTREELKEHIEIHTKQQCRICSRNIYVLRMNLHLESHLGETSHDCKVCRRPYVSRDSLVKHLRSKAHARTLEWGKLQSETFDEGDASVEVNEDEHENSSSNGVTETEEVEILFPDYMDDYSSDSENGNTVDPLAELSNGSSLPPNRRHSMESQHSSQSQNSNHTRNSTDVDRNNKKGWMKELLSKYNTQTDNSKATESEARNLTPQSNILKTFQNLEHQNPGSVESPRSHMSTSEDSGHSQSNQSTPLTVSYSSGTAAATGKDDHSETCPICQEICHGIFGIGNHMFRAHHVFRCPTCHFCSLTALTHELHIQVVHRDSNLFCKACKKLFLNEDLMARHEEGELHKLRVLQMENDALADLQEIRAEETDKDADSDLPQQLYNCQICSNTFHTVAKLEFHVLHLHEQFLCNICYKLFGSRKGLENHRRSHVGESQHDCLICMTPFRKLAALNSHKKSRAHLTRAKELDEETGDAPIQIAVSEPLDVEGDSQQSTEPTVFMIPDPSEDASQNENTSQSDETMECVMVSFPMQQQYEESNMNEHLRSRKSGVYECCLCQSEFREGEDFDEHMLAGHDVTLFKKVSSRIHKLFRSMNQTPQIFKCTACRKIFLDNSIFKKHWVKFHGTLGEAGNVETETTQPNKHIVELFNSTLKHVRSTIPTFFACANCDNLFQNQVDLNIHAVGCGTFEETIDTSQYLTSTGTPAPFIRKNPPQVIDLTEEEQDETKGEKLPSERNSPSVNSIYSRNNKGISTDDLLQSESNQPIIQYVYSLQGVPL